MVTNIAIYSGDCFMKNQQIAVVFIWMMCSISVLAQTVYFLAADFDPAYRTDSYVLPLTDPNDIAHARDLIANGPAAGQPWIMIQVACGADNINRNYLSSVKHPWNWHITGFNGFVDTFPPGYYGDPAMIHHACLMTATTQGTNGFSSYTVIAELGQNPKTWQGNLNSDGAVNLADIKILSQYWGSISCTSPSWCSNADINHDHFVNFADLELFADTWLTAYPAWPTRWYSAWANPRQCHGDADGLGSGMGSNKVWVNTADLAIFVTTLYLYCQDSLKLCKSLLRLTFQRIRPHGKELSWNDDMRLLNSNFLTTQRSSRRLLKVC
jgi:hypothetical protein